MKVKCPPELENLIKKRQPMAYECKETENFQFKLYLSAGLGNLGNNWM